MGHTIAIIITAIVTHCKNWPQLLHSEQPWSLLSANSDHLKHFLNVFYPLNKKCGVQYVCIILLCLLRKFGVKT